jgi:hypothetical protein
MTHRRQGVADEEDVAADDVGAVVGAELVGAEEVGAEVVGAEVAEELGLGLGLAEDEGLEEGDGLAEDDGLSGCSAGDGWCPRAGVTGLGDTTRWPAGASRIAASATAPPTAASPATVTVAG